jgi:hypothetical protein
MPTAERLLRVRRGHPLFSGAHLPQDAGLELHPLREHLHLLGVQLHAVDDGARGAAGGVVAAILVEEQGVFGEGGAELGVADDFGVDGLGLERVGVVGEPRHQLQPLGLRHAEEGEHFVELHELVGVHPAVGGNHPRELADVGAAETRIEGTAQRTSNGRRA